MPWRGPEYPGELPTLGFYVLDWLAEYLIVPDGPAAGQPLVLTDEQAQFVLDYYAVDPRFEGPAVRGKALNNGRRIRRAILCRAKGHGKALALDTRLPTPAGWTTMGAVRPGGQLLDESGDPCVVLAATEVMHGRPCYRIVFRDGTSIVADGDHLWPVEEFAGRGKWIPRTVTTREIAERGLRYAGPLTKGSAAGVARWKSLPTPPTRSRGRSVSYSQARTIMSIEPVESVPVRCVSVSSKSSLYLAGDGMIPTHNSPLLAGLCLVETLGDVVLDGWAADGEPVGRPWSSLGFKAKAQVVAVSEDQTGNTWDPLLEMAREGPVLDAYDIEPMETFVNVPRGRIEYTTSAAISREGFRPVFCALDQTESWVASNGGLKLAATLRRNLAKVGGSSVETPNAWVPGEDSVAEKSYEAWQKQTEGKLRGGDGILFDHREAPPDTNPADRDSLMAGLAFAYGDSADVNGGHVSLARILEDYWDPATDPADARRFYLNQIAPAADAWTTPQEWAALADPNVAVPDGDEIALFFDGSKSLDATALIGCHITTGHVFEIGVWEPDPGDPEDQVPVREVDAAVAMAFDRWSPVAFFADVREWESFVHASWPDAYGDRLVVHANPRGRNAGPIAWDMRARTYEFTMAAETCHTEITEKQFTHDGSSVVARHVANARRRPNRYGVSIGKESPRSPKKVDAAVCVIGARMVRRLVLASPEWAKRTSKKARSGRVYGFS